MIANAAADAENALNATSTAESTKLWNKLLGSDFPVVEAQQKSALPPVPPADPGRVQEAPRNQWA